MNRRAMTIRIPLLAALALLLSACGGQAPQSERPPLAGAAIGGPFTLTD
jgi:protein SCO1/2